MVLLSTTATKGGMLLLPSGRTCQDKSTKNKQKYNNCKKKINKNGCEVEGEEAPHVMEQQPQVQGGR